MKVLNSYILVTHGRRQVDAAHPGAVRQYSNLEDFARPRGGKVAWGYDYTRTITGGASLPTLFSLLERARMKQQRLFMDDTSRLFRACSGGSARAELLQALVPYKPYLVGLRQCGPLSDLSHEYITLLASGEMKANFQLPYARKRTRQVEDGSEQTSAANTASASARQAMSRRKATELSEVRAELREAGLPTTLAAIAGAANERGLTTTRARSWRADTVGRLLRKLGEEADENGSPQAG